MTFTDAAVEVLLEAGRPLHYKKIAEIAVRKNLLSHVGKSPEAVMGARLEALMQRPGDKRLLVEVKPGIYSLDDSIREEMLADRARRQEEDARMRENERRAREANQRIKEYERQMAEQAAAAKAAEAVSIEQPAAAPAETPAPVDGEPAAVPAPESPPPQRERTREREGFRDRDNNRERGEDRPREGRDRGDRYERGDRGDRNDRGDRPDRERGDRDRNERNDRFDRGDRNDRSDRFDRGDRGDRPRRMEFQAAPEGPANPIAEALIRMLRASPFRNPVPLQECARALREEGVLPPAGSAEAALVFAILRHEQTAREAGDLPELRLNAAPAVELTTWFVHEQTQRLARAAAEAQRRLIGANRFRAIQRLNGLHGDIFLALAQHVLALSGYQGFALNWSREDSWEMSTAWSSGDEKLNAAVYVSRRTEGLADRDIQKFLSLLAERNAAVAAVLSLNGFQDSAVQACARAGAPVFRYTGDWLIRRMETLGVAFTAPAGGLKVLDEELFERLHAASGLAPRAAEAAPTEAGGRWERPERADRGDRNDRPERGERADRPERPERSERPEREGGRDRRDRNDRFDRGDRADRGDRQRAGAPEEDRAAVPRADSNPSFKPLGRAPVAPPPDMTEAAPSESRNESVTTGAESGAPSALPEAAAPAETAETPAAGFNGPIEWFELGLIGYDEAMTVMQERRDLVIEEKAPEAIYLLEHPPVITLGRRAAPENLLADEDLLQKRGIQLVKSTRGGDVTYHGPGQMVVYLVIDYRRRGFRVPDFVSRVEQAMIDTLGEFKITGKRDPEHPGVWVNDRKIVALGFHLFKGVSSHGAALNVTPNLAHFEYIVPCGIKDRAVTSMAVELGRPPQMQDVAASLRKNLTTWLDPSSVLP
ncbi:MAG: Octanoyltransferase [Myxococcota bacterium]|nr:Octanoyltransferase [Myxococcota bacterium]